MVLHIGRCFGNIIRSAITVFLPLGQRAGEAPLPRAIDREDAT